jgi:hypothetical protein
MEENTQLRVESLPPTVSPLSPFNLYIDIVRLRTKEAIPGPGTYQPKTSMHQLGVYYVSNIENSKSTRISPTG